MLEYLPLELVGEILRVTAESCLPNDRQTMLNIALSCSLGYSSAIPVLYSAMEINKKNQHYVARAFSNDSAFVSGPLSIPPSQRLCSHIHRIFIDTQCNFLLANIRHLINLRFLSGFTLDPDTLPPSLYPAVTPTLKRCFLLSVKHPDQLPASVTHVSYYIRASASHFAAFQDYAERVIPDTVTHVALEINELVVPSYETALLSLLKTLLSRNSSAPVILRLYHHASGKKCRTVVLKAIARLESERLRRRMQLWRDSRPMIKNEDDIKTSKMDCIVGRTPWEEAEPVSQAELDAAEMETQELVDEEEHRASRN